ncbi:MAG TPA: hypothetical protein VFN61_07805 [Acidimicrobiales bacterium]|nr:hypothetical protein [Acidimicrobiales bacterium]
MAARVALAGALAAPRPEDFAGAFAGMAFAVLRLATGAGAAAVLRGRPTGRAGAALTLEAALRLELAAGAAFVALVALAGAAAREAVARPVDFAATALEAVAFEAVALEAAALEAVLFDAVLLAGVALAAADLRDADFLALRSALKPVAGLKRMPLEAAIFTGAPVRGLRPVRALRAVGLKLPKP